MPDQAVHEPIAAPRSAAGNVEMMSASALGVSSAPNAPCSARPAISNSMLGATAHSTETSAEARHADREHAPLAEEVAERPADEDQRPERQQVGVRDPLLTGEPAAEIVPDRGQRDVDGRRVQARDERAHDRREQRELLVRPRARPLDSAVCMRRCSGRRAWARVSVAPETSRAGLLRPAGGQAAAVDRVEADLVGQGADRRPSPSASSPATKITSRSRIACGPAVRAPRCVHVHGVEGLDDARAGQVTRR